MTFLFLALVGGVLVLWLYGRREIPVSGRWLLASARIASLCILLLLLWNPDIPQASNGGGETRPWLLVDASLSMGAGDPAPWERALERAREGEWEGVLTFGEEPRPLGADSPTRALPSALRSRVGPALERVAQSGGRRVVVASDFRLQDAPEIRERARRLGISLQAENLATDLVNAGVAEASFPASVSSGAVVSASVVVFSEGLGPSDSLVVQVREDGRLVASERVDAPEPGRLRRLSLDLPSPRGTGPTRYVVSASTAADGFPDDDERSVWVEVDPDEAGVLLVSLRPDWEPGFLLPVLERVTGLPGEAFLRVGDDRFMTSAGDGEGPRLLGASEVAGRLNASTILVVHGLQGNAPEWLVRALEGATRVLAFPADASGAALAGVSVGSPLPGEWFPAEPVPASPVAGDLAGIDMSRLPPLSDVLPVADDSAAAGVPLELRRRGRGPLEAAMVLLEEPETRRVVVLGQGLWRWGFREGPARNAYERLWAGIAGWLLAGDPAALGSEVRPRARSVPRGDPVRWQAPGMAGDTLRLRIRSAGDSVVLDTVLAAGPGGFSTVPLPPGTYSFLAERTTRSEGSVGEGRFDVESFSDELMTLSTPLEADVAPDPSDRPVSRTGRPLRTHPLPYLVVLGLLCAEWIGRRRKGLR